MIARLLTVVLLTLAAGAGYACERATSSDPDGVSAALRTSVLTARDLKTLHYVENAHSQLELWATRLIARLEMGLAPRQNDPMLDGRAYFEVQKLRHTYAGTTRSPALASAIRQLADRHERRLAEIQGMMRFGVDRAAFASTSHEVGHVIDAIRDWRSGQ